MSNLGPYPAVTLDEEIADLKRELTMREQVYWSQFCAGKLERHVAAQRIACTKATIARLEQQRDASRPQQTTLAL